MNIGSLKLEALPGDRWKLIEGYRVELQPEFNIKPVEIPAGFITDLASVPKFLRGSMLGRRIDTEEASVPHDFGRQNGYLPLANGRTHTVTKSEIDRIFKAILKKSGVGFFRRNAMYAAVRMGALFS